MYTVLVSMQIKLECIIIHNYYACELSYKHFYYSGFYNIQGYSFYLKTYFSQVHLLWHNLQKGCTEFYPKLKIPRYNHAIINIQNNILVVITLINDFN